MAGSSIVSCPRTLVFLRMMIRMKSLQAWEKWSVGACSSCWVWVVTAASSANSMSLMRALWTFVLALRWPRSKSLPSDLVRRQIPSDAVPKAHLKSRAKKILKSVWARTHPCLTPADVKGLGGAAIKLHSSFHVCVKGINHALQFWWAEESGRDRLCWQYQTPLWGQWKWYTGAFVVLCTSPGVGEGRRPYLLLTFQLRSHTVIQDRHILPASAVRSRWPLQRLCQWCWEGRCLCSCCSRSSLPCS